MSAVLVMLMPVDLAAQQVSQMGGAPLETHARVAVTILRSGDPSVPAENDALLTPRLLPDSTGMTAREKRVLKHTLWGTVAGFAVGIVVGTQLHTGCDTSGGACDASDRKRNIVLSVGGVGALLGVGVGTVVGLVREVAR